MKITRTISTLILISLILALLISCGNDVGTPHPEGCTCEECIAAKGDNDPEKGDTPPADGENGDTPPADGENGDTGITHTFLYSDYSMLGAFLHPAFFVNKHDMKWLDDYINNHEGLGEEAREKLLDYIAELPDDFLEHSFMYITLLFNPHQIEEDSFRVVMEDGNLKALYIIKEECSKLQRNELHNLPSGDNLLIIKADKDLYHDDMKFIFSNRQVKVRDTASISLDGNTKDPSLTNRDVEHSLLCSTHDIKNPFIDQDYYTVLGRGYHSDISNVDSWGFSPVIDSTEELGTMLSALGVGSTAQEELEALGLTDQIFQDKVLIPFATRLYDSEIGSYNLLANVCRVNGDGVLELELEADIDFSYHTVTYLSSRYAVRITYVVIDRSVIEGITGINEALIAFDFRFLSD